MSFMDCINKKVAAGLLTKKQAEALQNKYEKLAKRYARTMGDVEAVSAAAARVVGVEAEIIAQRNKNKVHNALAQKKLYDNVTSNLQNKLVEYEKLSRLQKSFIKKPSVDKEVNKLLEDAYIRGQTIQTQHTRKLADFIEKYGSRSAGLKQETKGITDVVRAAMGADTGDSALNALGKDIRGVFDSLHQQIRNAGGIVGKIPNYFPQVHKKERLLGAGFDKWRNDILPLLDIDATLDDIDAPLLRGNELDIMLKEVYETITTDGLNKLKRDVARGVSVRRGVGIAQRQGKTRKIHFKDADAFIQYNDLYGVGESGLFDAVLAKVHSMSRDIGIMQKLSPDSDAFMNYAKTFMQSQGVGGVKTNNTLGLYDVLVGRLAYDGGWIFNSVMGYQNIHRAAVLGSAPISALSDSTFIYMATKANGLDGVKAVKTQLKLLNPANSSDRRHIERMLYASQASLGAGFHTARMSDAASGNGVFVNTTRAISGITHRMSGLAAMTEAAGNAASLELSGFMAEMAITKTPWESLKPDFKAALLHNGLTKQQYDIIIKAKPSSFGDGATFMRGEDVIALGGDDAYKAGLALEDWMMRTRQRAVNEPNLQTRAVTTGAAFGEKAGQSTVIRGLASSVFMYKGFSLTMYQNFLKPAIEQAAVGKYGDIGVLLTGSTLLGAVAFQLKEMLKGREPMDMDRPDFWYAAAIQGGGFGYYAEFLFRDVNQYGRSLQQELMGPVVGTVDELQKALVGNVSRAIDGKDTRFAKDLTDLAYRNIPGHSLWYARLPLERYVKDTLGRMTDPAFDSKARKTMRKYKKETGQDYWWPKGKYAPQ